MVEDQWHHGTEHRLPLHLEEHVDSGTEGDPHWRPEYLTVYPVKDFAREATVFLGKGEGQGAQLTPDEASKLARELLLVVAQIADDA